MEIGYYPGCSGAGSGVEYKLSTLKTAEMFGIKLQELKDWNCCGATSAHNTNRLLSLALPARNLAIMEQMKLDTLLAPCAACYNRHRAVEIEAREDEGTRQNIQAAIGMDFSARSTTVSVLEWLVRDVGLEVLKTKVSQPLKGMKAACYYGCLLVRPVAHTGFDDAEDPQTMDQIMTALGAAVVDWPYKTECCGAALATSRPDIGSRMIYEVIQNAKEAGAECIITACPLCMLNLDMRQAKVEKTMGAKFDMPVYYITEMVALAGGYSPEEIGVPRHFVEAMGYLNSLPEKAAALAAQEEAQKPKKAVKKAESGNAAKTESAAPAAADEIDEKALQKKIEAIFKGIQKNPEKIAARMIEDPERAQVLAELMADDKKSLKIAELLVTDKDKAAKVAEAFVTGELKKREK